MCPHLTSEYGHSPELDPLPIAVHSRSSRSIAEQPGREIMQAPPPGLPLVISAGRGVEDVVDASTLQRLVHRERAGVNALLRRAGAKPKQLHLLVEGCRIAERAAVGGRHVEALARRAAHRADPRE